MWLIKEIVVGPLAWGLEASLSFELVGLLFLDTIYPIFKIIPIFLLAMLVSSSIRDSFIIITINYLWQREFLIISVWRGVMLA